MTPGRRPPGAADVAAFLDREAIREEMTAYLEAIARHAWTRVAEHFTPDACLDYGTPGVRDVEGNLARLRAGMERLTGASTLLGMQVRVRTHGDRAESETSAFTAHRPADATAGRARVSAVRYTDVWVHGADGRWRVCERVVHPDVKGWLALA